MLSETCQNKAQMFSVEVVTSFAEMAEIGQEKGFVYLSNIRKKIPVSMILSEMSNQEIKQMIEMKIVHRVLRRF